MVKHFLLVWKVHDGAGSMHLAIVCVPMRCTLHHNIATHDKTYFPDATSNITTFSLITFTVFSLCLFTNTLYVLLRLI